MGKILVFGVKRRAWIGDVVREVRRILGGIRESSGCWRDPECEEYFEGLGLEERVTRKAMYV